MFKTDKGVIAIHRDGQTYTVEYKGHNGNLIDSIEGLPDMAAAKFAVQEIAREH